MNIKYNNKNIKNNDFLSPNKTQIEPEVLMHFDENKLYTLIMYDPDAVNGTHIHWLITNIKNNISNSKTILSYKGPAPPLKTGKHRYIFEIYEQSNGTNNFTKSERSINSIEMLKKELNISNLISKIQFISENESGGKLKRTKNKRTKNKNKNKNKRKTKKNF
jgi:phosphatidylethanolamine-binding protein (PEBP) family uncharacterized protein